MENLTIERIRIICPDTNRSAVVRTFEHVSAAFENFKETRGSFECFSCGDFHNLDVTMMEWLVVAA